jgi:hypothetical protein
MGALDRGSSYFTDLPWETVSLNGLAVSFGRVQGIYEVQGRGERKRAVRATALFLLALEQYVGVSVEGHGLAGMA